MRTAFSAALVALTLAIASAERASAQGTYSGKAVYGMFGPRVLGETQQSPVERRERGIARDAYGDFLGRNQAYSGMRFPEARAREPGTVGAPISPQREALPPAAPPPAAPSLPEEVPESQPLPDEWLRSPGVQLDMTPQSSPAELGLPDSSSLRGPRSGAEGPGWAAAMVGYPSARPAMDPFSGRIASMLQSTAQIKKRSSIRVDVVGETAILRGRVATQQDRELAENLVRLEPGIWEVKNLLIAEDSARVTTISIRAAGQ